MLRRSHSHLLDPEWVLDCVHLLTQLHPSFLKLGVLPSLPCYHAKRNGAVTEPVGTDGAYL